MLRATTLTQTVSAAQTVTAMSMENLQSCVPRIVAEDRVGAVTRGPGRQCSELHSGIRGGPLLSPPVHLARCPQACQAVHQLLRRTRNVVGPAARLPLEIGRAHV